MPHELLKSEVQIIASSEYNFKVELILDIGREDIIRDKVYQMGIESGEELEITNAKISSYNKNYIRFLYNLV